MMSENGNNFMAGDASNFAGILRHLNIGWEYDIMFLYNLPVKWACRSALRSWRRLPAVFSACKHFLQTPCLNFANAVSRAALKKLPGKLMIKFNV